MHDDYDSPIAPFGRRRRRSRKGEGFLVACCVGLAIASASFPWYVFFNAEKFGVQTVELGRMRDLPPVAGRSVVSVSPLAMPDSTKDEPSPEPPIAVDTIVTATASEIGEEADNGAVPITQPFPARGSFRLLHVANGRALIEDRSGMYMVRIGSVLPDSSKLAHLEQRDGRWVIVTSRGEVYADAGAAQPPP